MSEYGKNKLIMCVVINGNQISLIKENYGNINYKIIFNTEIIDENHDILDALHKYVIVVNKIKNVFEGDVEVKSITNYRDMVSEYPKCINESEND